MKNKMDIFFDLDRLEQLNNILNVSNENKYSAIVLHEFGNTYKINFKNVEFYINKEYTNMIINENNEILVDIRYLIKY
jgi:hypothetical protein